ncbi:MAG TPA: family 43 glycosylhydrolase [Gemmatimonadales bacterium]
MSGNPILPGWYADPEAHVFEGQYWIYATTSARYNQQTYMDAWSSPDLVTWTRHPHVLDTANVHWAHRAVWAPSIVKKGDWYYLFFGANDIQSDSQVGGIGVARARTPAGPFLDYLGKPLIDAFHNGAQPIDQMVFRDVDGTYYIAYGGWGHCNIAKLNDDFTGLMPLPDGSMFKEITPKGYVEGAFMLIKGGKYYFMWSEGGWTGPDYAVAYAVGNSPFGPFERVGKILQQDPAVATGAGHHSVLHADNSPNWYIVYHRRPLGETDANHRAVSIDKLVFNADGSIAPVVITAAGVPADPLPPSPVSVPAVDTFPAHDALTIDSKSLGEARPINVHLPAEYRAGGITRYPVLYMPDGGMDEDFPHVVRRVDSLVAHHLIRPVIVVGIPNTERRRDLTGPTSVKSDSEIAPHVGGSAVFRQFIATELIPEIDRRYRTTPERSIVGESLAGLFVMETFLEQPALFTHYVAFDPSLWWNNGALVGEAKADISRLGGAKRSLYFATSHEPSTADGAARIAAMLRIDGPKTLTWTYRMHPELEHSNIFMSLEREGLIHALH